MKTRQDSHNSKIISKNDISSVVQGESENIFKENKHLPKRSTWNKNNANNDMQMQPIKK